jgi:ribosomal protein S18 acetylase RimI-like enzyme
MTSLGSRESRCSRTALSFGDAKDVDPSAVRLLTDVSTETLRPLLLDEAEHWCAELGWDYSDVIDAIIDGLRAGTVYGWACMEGSQATAYCYAVEEPPRAVVGSIYASRAHRDRGLETLLLERLLAEMIGKRAITRIECQTLFCTSMQADDVFKRRGFSSRGRRYMIRDLESVCEEQRREAGLRRVEIRDLERIGQLVFESHRGSADAVLNATYASPEQSRHFVDSIVCRCGCGPLETEASLVAETRGSLSGVVLVTRISRNHAHICQISVRPDMQRRGIGSALLGGALEALRHAGLRHVTLSTTDGNYPASRLYARQGFRTHRVFMSHAWVRLPGRIPLIP